MIKVSDFQKVQAPDCKAVGLVPPVGVEGMRKTIDNMILSAAKMFSDVQAVYSELNIRLAESAEKTESYTEGCYPTGAVDSSLPALVSRLSGSLRDLREEIDAVMNVSQEMRGVDALVRSELLVLAENFGIEPPAGMHGYVGFLQAINKAI